MEIRQAFPNEVDTILRLIAEARAYIASYGSDQWQDGYPDARLIFEDVLSGSGYVAVLDGEIAAYAAVLKGHEEAYDAIYEGRWQHNHYHYATFHRVAAADRFRGQQIVQTFLQGLIEGTEAADFRADTHPANQAMQHVLEKLGFVYCGKVPVDGERLAYQKIKQQAEKAVYQEVPKSLQDGL